MATKWLALNLPQIYQSFLQSLRSKCEQPHSGKALWLYNEATAAKIDVWGKEVRDKKLKSFEKYKWGRHSPSIYSI